MGKALGGGSGWVLLTLSERDVRLRNVWAADHTHTLADGPAFAHANTKKCLHDEWNLSIDAAIDLEAEAQAVCMETNDFSRAYHAFVNKKPPVFEGN